MRVKNFLKPDRFHHKSEDIRLAALAELADDDPAATDLIAELAQTDESATVRAAAIDRLSDVLVLAALQQPDASVPGDSVEHARVRLVTLLEAGAASDEAVRELLTLPGQALVETVAAHSANGEQRQLAVRQITDEAALLEVVQQSRFHDTRQQAAARLVTDEIVRAALAACRSRDKVVARELQQRLDEKAAEQARVLAEAESVQQTLDTLRTLSANVWSPQHAGRLQAVSERWQGLPSEHRAAHDIEFSALQQQVQAVLDEHQPATQPAPEEPVADALDAQGADESPVSTTANNESASSADHASHAEPADPSAASGKADDQATADADAAPVPVLAEPSAELVVLKQQLGSVALADLPSTLAALHAEPTATPVADRNAVLAHADAVAVLFDPPFEINKGRPQAVKKRLARVATLLATDTLLSGIDTSGIAYLQELQQHHEALLARQGKAQQESADRVGATHRQFAALGSAVTEGKWGPASSMLRRLQKKITAMEPAERAGLNDKLARAEKQLEEMADWQDFASRPKLEALCEQMEALAAGEAKPRQRAKAVKDLQNQWKAMGVSRVANELWPRFKTAGDTAFEPCKAFFEAQQQERDTKLRAKAELCATLEAAAQDLDAESPDYKAIQRLVNNAKRDWTRNRVPDRKPDKALEERFSQALKPFDALLNEQYDANAALKQDLVDKVAKLAEGEINQHNVNQARSLQSAWKQVGITRRREDQALWEAFNGHCRTIFKQQHDAERERYRASMGHVFRARDIIKALNKLAKNGQPDDAQVQALTSEFQELEAFPDKDRKFLQRDFRAAVDACSRIRDTESKRRRQAEQDEITRLVQLCEQLEEAVEMPDTMGATTRDDVQHAWDNSEIRPGREELQALEARRDAALTHLDAGSRFDYAANEEQRRDLLIRMEVLAGVETPSEDKSRRMRYQLENLQEGMTSAAVTDTRKALAEKVREWHALGPVTRAQRDALNSRFLKATGR